MSSVSRAYVAAGNPQEVIPIEHPTVQDQSDCHDSKGSLFRASIHTNALREDRSLRRVHQGSASRAGGWSRTSRFLRAYRWCFAAVSCRCRHPYPEPLSRATGGARRHRAQSCPEWPPLGGSSGKIGGKQDSVSKHSSNPCAEGFGSVGWQTGGAGEVRKRSGLRGVVGVGT